MIAASQWLTRSALFAVLPTTSSVSCIQWHGAWQQRRPTNSSVCCRLDYCNALLYGIADDLLRRLQSRMRQLAWSVDPAGQSDHITPVLRRLHWSPVRRRIEFKLALLIYKSLNGSSPRHVSDDCQLVSDIGRRRLRASEFKKLLKTHLFSWDCGTLLTAPCTN